MPTRPNDPEYRAGMAADRIRRRAEKHIREGRAIRAVEVFARALSLTRRYHPNSAQCRALALDLYYFEALAFAAHEGQETIRRELTAYHTTAAGDFCLDDHRMQA